MRLHGRSSREAWRWVRRGDRRVGQRRVDITSVEPRRTAGRRKRLRTFLQRELPVGKAESSSVLLRFWEKCFGTAHRVGEKIAGGHAEGRNRNRRRGLRCFRTIHVLHFLLISAPGATAGLVFRHHDHGFHLGVAGAQMRGWGRERGAAPQQVGQWLIGRLYRGKGRSMAESGGGIRRGPGGDTGKHSVLPKRLPEAPPSTPLKKNRWVSYASNNVGNISTKLTFQTWGF